MYYSIKPAKGQGILNGASLRDMMHLLCKYDVAHFIRNDAMFSNSLGEADNIHEVNIISDAPSFAIRQISAKQKALLLECFGFVIRVRKRTG